MCLSCVAKYENNKLVINGDEIKKSLNFQPKKVYLRNVDNSKINLSKDQIKEISDNALAIIITGIDFSTDIWAIQWKNDYKVKTL